MAVDDGTIISDGPALGWVCENAGGGVSLLVGSDLVEIGIGWGAVFPFGVADKSDSIVGVAEGEVGFEGDVKTAVVDEVFTVVLSGDAPAVAVGDSGVGGVCDGVFEDGVHVDEEGEGGAAAGCDVAEVAVAEEEFRELEDVFVVVVESCEFDVGDLAVRDVGATDSAAEGVGVAL